MRKIIFILFITFILFSAIPLVRSAPPSSSRQIGEFTEGLSLSSAFFGIHEINENIHADVHVFNITNGVQLDSTLVTCNFHLYNHSGHPILEGALISHDDHFAVDIGGGNFSTPGLYSASVHCNNSIINTAGIGGFEVVNFVVTRNGNTPPSEFVIVIFSFAFIVILMVMLWGIMNIAGSFITLGIAVKKKVLREDQLINLKDLMYSWGSYFSCLALYGLSIEYLGNAMIENFLSMLIGIGVWTHILLPLLAFILYFFIGKWKELSLENTGGF